MLHHTPHYPATIRKYTVAFGLLFSDISIIRDNGSLKKVPISYESRTQWMQRLNQKNSIDENGVEIRGTVPRLSFILDSFSYDPSRMTTKSTKVVKQNSNGSHSVQYKPVPYNFNFTLNGYSNNITDILQIAEQIVPHFAPSLHLEIKDNPLFPEESSSIPVYLNSSNIITEVEGEVRNRKYSYLEMQFQMKGTMFGPVTSGNIIKHSIIDLYEFDRQRNLNEKVATFEAFGERFSFDDTSWKFDSTDILLDTTKTITEIHTDYTI